MTKSAVDPIMIMSEVMSEEEKRRAAGNILLPGSDGIQFGAAGHQDLFHIDIQKCTECIKIVDRRQALALLPLVDGLGLFKAEPVLQIPNAETAALTQAKDILAGCHGVDHGKGLSHSNSSFDSISTFSIHDMDEICK